MVYYAPKWSWITSYLGRTLFPGHRGTRGYMDSDSGFDDLSTGNNECGHA